MRPVLVSGCRRLDRALGDSLVPNGPSAACRRIKRAANRSADAISEVRAIASGLLLLLPTVVQFNVLRFTGILQKLLNFSNRQSAPQAVIGVCN